MGDSNGADVSHYGIAIIHEWWLQNIAEVNVGTTARTRPVAFVDAISTANYIADEMSLVLPDPDSSYSSINLVSPYSCSCDSNEGDIIERLNLTLPH